MKKKDSENQLVIAQSGWEMVDNYGDNILEAVLDGPTADILSAVPVATIAMGLIRGIRRYKDQKNYQKFISFVQNYKSNTDEKISKYLNDHPESELGEYTSSMIEDLTSVRQTEMLGRTVALLLNGKIDEEKFFECGYIISKIDPYLFNLINQLNKVRTNPKPMKEGVHIKSYLPNPNMDLASFGFIKQVEQDAYVGVIPIARYEKTEKLDWFYKNIIQGI